VYQPTDDKKFIALTKMSAIWA